MTRFQITIAVIGVSAAIIGVVLRILTLLYQRGVLPAKYRMTDMHPMCDAVTVKLFMEKGDVDRLAGCFIRYQVPQYLADGYKVVRILYGREFPIGRECVWTGKVSDGSVQECVLMAKPKPKSG